MPKLKYPLTHAEFRDECRHAFAYLMTDYGFMEQPEHEDPERYMIRFASSTTRIVIRGGGFGRWTDVFFDRATAVPEKSREKYGFNALNLFAARGYSFPLRDYAFEKIGCWVFLTDMLPLNRDPLQSHQQLQIPVYAEALRTAGADVLSGDFSVLPDVLVQAERRYAALTPDEPREPRVKGRIRDVAIMSILIATPCLAASLLMVANTMSDRSEITARRLFALAAAIAFSALVGGIGLLKWRKWARILILVVGCVVLVAFPFGTVYGVWAIHILSRRDARQLFT